MDENARIPVTVSVKGSIDNSHALVKVMAWCQTGAKPLKEPILTQFNDTNMPL